MCSYGVCRSYDPENETPKEGSYIDYIRKHRIHLEDDTSDSVNGQIEYSTDNSRLGGWPTPEYTPLEIAEDGLEEVAKVAMGSLSDKADLLIQYDETWDKLSQQFSDGESDADGESRTFQWFYGDGYLGDFRSDIGHFIEVDYEQPLDSNASFYIDSTMEETGGASLGVNWKIHVQSPDLGDDGGGGDTTTDDDSGGSTTTDDGGGSGGCGSAGCPYSINGSIGEQMTEKQRKEWGMVKVHVSKVREAGVPVKNPKTVDGNMMWFSTSPKVTLEPVTYNR